MKRGMTAAAFQSLGISDDMKERLNRLVIGVATMAADSFRNSGSRLSSPADLYGSRFCSSFRTWKKHVTNFSQKYPFFFHVSKTAYVTIGARGGFHYLQM